MKHHCFKNQIKLHAHTHTHTDTHTDTHTHTHTHTHTLQGTLFFLQIDSTREKKEEERNHR